MQLGVVLLFLSSFQQFIMQLGFMFFGVVLLFIGRIQLVIVEFGVVQLLVVGV